ncbi:MAG: cation:proton antiporter [Gemmatimonadota bacterium]|nr:cation:proton antiporter [Gemmatimonadota bacterium]MDH3421538.1 cation:proton antiporter [Gemmatimonadota bacterium]
MHASLLADVVILLVVSIGVLYGSRGIKLPPVVGFLITGMLLGPHGLGLVQGVEEVEQLAEIGVVLLLFTIGLEFSLAELLRMRRAVLVGGSVQIVVVTTVAWAGLLAAGLPSRQALFLGMTASLSSTAVVLRLLQQSAEVEAPHGRMSLAILVYQDLMIVPMMLLVPLLAGTSGGVVPALGGFVAQATAILVLVVVLARFIVPQLLGRVVHTRSRDLFLLTVVTVCLGVAWMSSLAGLSLPLGAFLAGLLISESEYSHQALADILPFRDLFAIFFFISVGMLLDLELAASQPLFLFGLVVAVLLLKSVAAGVATLVVGSSLTTGVQTGLAMSQVGEFSFVLAGVGLAAGLMTDLSYQWFVAVAVATIGVTPFLMRAAPAFSAAVTRLPLVGRLEFREGSQNTDVPEASENHLVIIGYGINGQNVARAAAVASIPHLVVDMNPTLVASERARGVPIHYGDATRQALLEHMGVARAHAVVIVLSDAAATRQVTALARSLNPGCSIVARTRYVREVEALKELGADTVIPEELETSVEIVSRVLASYMVPRREIEAFVSEMRAGDYEMWRRPRGDAPSLFDLRQSLSDVEITTLRVDPRSAIVGQRLADSELRRIYGVTVVAIRRGDEVLANPGGDERVSPDDLLVVLGLGEEIAAASVLVSCDSEAEADA